MKYDTLFSGQPVRSIRTMHRQTARCCYDLFRGLLGQYIALPASINLSSLVTLNSPHLLDLYQTLSTVWIQHGNLAWTSNDRDFFFLIPGPCPLTSRRSILVHVRSSTYFQATSSDTLSGLRLTTLASHASVGPHPREHPGSIGRWSLLFRGSHPDHSAHRRCQWRWQCLGGERGPAVNPGSVCHHPQSPGGEGLRRLHPDCQP
jgi:hypothetical protein